MQCSTRLFDGLADDYDAHFKVAHRRAYDELAWELVQPYLPDPPGLIVDAGCGTGRWAGRLVRGGHHVVGIERAPRMAAVARAALASEAFELHETSMEGFEFAESRADVVLALGSLQYTEYPERVLERFARWTRPGGRVIVLVDSLAALILELLAADRHVEAMERLRTRRGLWIQGEYASEHHLFDRHSLEAAFRHAGLQHVRTHGLLVGASALGRERLTQNLTDAWDFQFALERQLSMEPALIDTGKQLLGIGQR